MLHLVLLCLIAPVFSSHHLQHIQSFDGQPEIIHQWEPESPEARYLGLSSGASRVVPNIKITFSCVGRRYGYFADVDNNCQLFHICQPSTAANGAPVIYHYTKFCPNQTHFDQQVLSCVSLSHPTLTPCGHSLQYFQQTETRFAENPVPFVHREVFQQIPEQRVEVYAEAPAVKSTVFRSEPLPQMGSQTIVSQTQPIATFKNVETTPVQTFSNQAFIAPAFPQPVISTPVEAPKPVFFESMRRSVPQTSGQFVQSTQFSGQPMVQPLHVSYQPLMPISQTAPVVRSTQYTVPFARSAQVIPFTKQVVNYMSAVPQVFKVFKDESNVVRPAQH